MVFDLSGSSKQYLLVERNMCETLARQAPDLTVSSCTDQKSIPNNHQSDARPRSALISFLCRARSESFRFITRDFLECFFYAFFNLKKKSSFFHDDASSSALTDRSLWLLLDTKKCIWRVFSVSFSI